MSTLAEKLIKSHLVEGKPEPGEEIGLKIDHTLIQDSTGTLTDLQFEAIGIPKVQTELSFSFADHNTIQNDFKNMDDHRYLQSVAAKYGLIFSRPGNGICHQVFLERFAQPGKTLLGSDSHTPTAGGVGCLAFGAGGLDVAAAMAGEPYYLMMPEVVGVELTGQLPPRVSAKDVILEVLRRVDVKGARGKILEYYGLGAETLNVPERATITNMGTETGAASSLFPSDGTTRKFLEAQGRPDQWVGLSADPDVEYKEVISIDLSSLEPMIALPHSPGNVVKVREVEGTAVDQVCVGSCTNSSLKDLKTVAQMLKDRRVNPTTSLTISPGSRQVLTHLAQSGDLEHILDAGGRVLECACGPCIGMGQAPCSNGVSLRTFNRNFKGRSGTQDASIYLVSPETAAASAITGIITDPRDIDASIELEMPERFAANDNMLMYPPEHPEDLEVIRGPNIKPLPNFTELPPVLTGEILIKLGDDITTDHILPAGAEILPLRSNIPEISKHVFKEVDPSFYERAKAKQGGIIVAGENYGQGSSREHAAIVPKYLGVKAVITKSFSRIHEMNLVNFGILPLTFENEDDSQRVNQGDLLKIRLEGLNDIELKHVSRGATIPVSHRLSGRKIVVLLAGGRLPYLKKMLDKRR